MDLSRLLRHMLLPDWWVLRAFPKSALRRVEQAVTASERRHQGELRVVIEAHPPLGSLLRKQTPRQRAIALFGELGVWDTEQNSGVLIYLQLIDRRVEIVADRGIDARVGAAFWRVVCARIESAFSEGRYEQGVMRALAEITEALAEHFPATADHNPDELPNVPLIF